MTARAGKRRLAPRKGTPRASSHSRPSRPRPPRRVPAVAVTDRDGHAVKVGTRVRVLEVTESLRDRLPPKEWRELRSMVGEIFEVYEIDEHGAAWVEKAWLNKKGDYSFGHSYALDSHEMEVVTGGVARRPTKE